MADGPAVQAASLRALESGMTVVRLFDLVRRFRKVDSTTPLVLMGYYNPIHAYGTARFAKDAADAGVDGLITVDLPPEEDEVLRAPASAHGLNVIRLATPTTDEHRLKVVLKDASGYLYYVAIAGVTGTKDFSPDDVRAALARLKAHTDLPIAVGFGIKTPEQAGAIAQIADAAVVGSSIVSKIGENVASGRARIVEDVVNFCEKLAKSVHAARRSTVLD